ncbi:MAG: hypothetical protein IPN83_26970 [Holophagales bacterium]|nr:hypothetical protein [Holophagales bacterium]
MILVDSSVLISFFRGQETPAVRYLAEIEASGEAASWALPLVCLQEILQGARNEREWKLLRSALETQEIVGPRSLWRFTSKPRGSSSTAGGRGLTVAARRTA